MGLGGLIAGAAPLLAACEDNSPVTYKSVPSASLYPVKRNTLFKLNRPETPEKLATTYNNFYEFGSHNPTMASGQKQGWYPWPYREGLTIAEATNDLAFIATGL